MGDLELLKNQHEVDCALTVLGYCYKFDSLKVIRVNCTVNIKFPGEEMIVQ